MRRVGGQRDEGSWKGGREDAAQHGAGQGLQRRWQRLQQQQWQRRLRQQHLHIAAPKVAPSICSMCMQQQHRRPLCPVPIQAAVGSSVQYSEVTVDALGVGDGYVHRQKGEQWKCSTSLTHSLAAAAAAFASMSAAPLSGLLRLASLTRGPWYFLRTIWAFFLVASCSAGSRKRDAMRVKNTDKGIGCKEITGAKILSVGVHTGMHLDLTFC